ncbi:MAG TPA: hypothetical protein ENJ37_10970 [Deltaproteobacteria bacterium]|nr:hypothetical protein [Deltaproteobacteria bacterium]
MGVAEDIDLLEEKIGRLKTDYEKHFARLIKHEPVKLRGEVERLILRYYGYNFTNTGLRFRFNNLVSRYNTYKQYWARILRAIEEGTYDRTVGGRRVAAMKKKAPAQEMSAATSASGADAQRGDGGLADLYERYVEARRRCNQPVKGISREKLEAALRRQRQLIEKKYGPAVELDYDVKIEGGKAKISIRPKKKK